MNATYKADPRFDPLRNARELGSQVVPLFYLNPDAGAGTTNTDTTAAAVSNLPWVRIGIVLFVIVAIWKLGK